MAIGAAAVSAWAFRDHLQVGNDALSIIAVTAAANVLMAVVPDRASWTRIAAAVSPYLGLGGWAVLAGVSGGTASPFLAGFSLEILLSTWTASASGTLGVTAGSITLLGVLAGVASPGAPSRILVLQSGFLLAMGAVTLLITREWRRSRSESTRRHAALEARLQSLENEIEALRTMGAVGENVANLAHALKNTLHSLRGFAALIDAERSGCGGNAEAHAGLRAAIERLEEIVRITLRGAPHGRPAESPLDAETVRRLIEEAVAEAAAIHPGVAWRTRIAPELPEVRGDRATLREALLNLARNAAEAMHGGGEVVVETAVDGDRFEIRVRDRGGGFSERDLGGIARPGYSTKPGGSGFGLFLTRRLVESQGGVLTVAPAKGGGAVVSVGLPLGNGTS